VGLSAQACGTTPTSGASYAYNGQGLRVSVTTSTTTTDQTWDSVSGGNLPLLLNDATTATANPGATTNTSYLYGNLLFGGSAPNEQISGSSAYFLLSNPSGVQAVYNASGTIVQQSSYSAYGTQTNAGGTASITPFGFQGTYTDSTGLLYSINRFYDPATNQFISVDPDVQQTDQPYAFVNGNPLNASDPLGLKKYLIQPFSLETTTTVNITQESLSHIAKHIDETGLSDEKYLRAILQTLRVPGDVVVQPGNHTLLYSGPIEDEEVENGQVVSLTKKVMFVSIDETNGSLVTAYLSHAPSEVRKAWSEGPWINRNVNAPPPPEIW
jgi:RHS repeat-associated protein